MTKRSQLSRRALLQGILGTSALSFGALAGLGTLFGGAAQAAAEDTYFIFCYFQGGWDILLSLDPRDPALFTDENRGDTLIQPGYSYLDSPPNGGRLVEASNGMVFGPYIGELAQQADRLSVIRGLSMETLTHEVGRRRFLTGKVPAGLLARGSSAATWLASRLGAGALIPNLSVRVESYNVDQPTYASALKVDSQADLLRALSAGPNVMDPRIEAQIDALLRDSASCPSARLSDTYQSAEESRLQADLVIAQGLGASFDFGANTPAMAALRDHYGFTASSSGIDSPAGQAALAATAITQGISRCVSITVTPNLDTHDDDWTTDQGPDQMGGFNAIARLARDLASREYKGTGESWLDHTAILGFSEFSRTALLNANGGRDHSLTNACFVMGGGLRGGQVVGRSSDVGLAPLATNLATGATDPGGEIIRPDHVLRTLLVKGGLEEDVADLRVEPIGALL